MFGIPKAVFLFLAGFLIFDLILVFKDPAIKLLAKKPISTPQISTKTTARVGTDFGDILGAQTEASPSATPEPTPSPKKSKYVIAAIGDSMVETMGDSLEYLQVDLKSKYPGTGFDYYNYGIGSENIEEALVRFDGPFNKGTKHYPSLAELHPDILIVGSWAYNPVTPYDRDKYYQDLSEVLEKAKKVGVKVYLFSEIAPLSDRFGEGPGGVNWPDEIVKPHVANIISNLILGGAVAKAEKVPVIDAFDKSKVSGNFGTDDLVGTHDGIHPSILGEQFIAKLIADTIQLDP